MFGWVGGWGGGVCVFVLYYILTYSVLAHVIVFSNSAEFNKVTVQILYGEFRLILSCFIAYNLDVKSQFVFILFLVKISHCSVVRFCV